MKLFGRKNAAARRRRGFTIVELLVVIAVLAVLMGIVSTAAASVMRKSRARKNDALRTLLQQGIMTYHAQKNHWPPENDQLDDWAENGVPEGGDPDERGYLNQKQYDDLMRHLMKECLNARGNPVMDVSGFTAVKLSAVNSSKKDKDGNPSCSGEDIQTWVAKQRAGDGPKSDQMAFGYANSERNHFRRFRIRFVPETGSVKVEFAKGANSR